MAVAYKTSMTKPELLELAIVNGVAVDDGMTKPQIVAALEAHNDAERKAEATLATDSARTGGAEVAEGNDPTPEENAAESRAESADDTAGTGAEYNAAAEALVLAAQDGADDTETTGASNDTTTEENAAQSATEGAEGYDLFVYAGPTLPRGRLKENSVFRGSVEDVKAYLADVLEEYPQAAKLIVPAVKLGAFSVKVKTPGNIAHKYYNDIVSAMHGNKEV